jgi:DNA-directed RNA polymerase sigma subunit (sigma70/sigma32)
MRARYEELDGDEGSDASDTETGWMQELIRQARATGSLAEGDEARLLRQAAAGDPHSQERLVTANLGLVIRLAEARDEQGLSFPDLVQEGSIGLVGAVRSFAASGLDDFARFAEQRIVAQMDAAIASEAAAVRDAELLVAAASDCERTELLMRRELHRLPTEVELAEKLEWTVDRTRYVAQVVADARRQHDEEMLQFIDPEAIVIEAEERGELDT